MPVQKNKNLNPFSKSAADKETHSYNFQYSTSQQNILKSKAARQISHRG